MKRFPEAKFTAVGAFIFLRFFCPAIVAPDVEGLISAAPSKEMRRGLLLIAKVIQNLANNVLFGAKEPYMFPLNDFLTQHIYPVTTFLREISVSALVSSLLQYIKFHRYRQISSSPTSSPNPSTLVLALHSIDFFTTTGIMLDKRLLSENGKKPSAHLSRSPRARSRY